MIAPNPANENNVLTAVIVIVCLLVAMLVLFQWPC